MTSVNSNLKPPPSGMEYWTSGTGQFMVVHAKDRCSGHCAIHVPATHGMKDWPLHWRSDRSFMERICPHGIGHPDPQQMDFLRVRRGALKASYEGVHGCDLCCSTARQDFIDGEIVVNEIENPRKAIES